MTTKVERRRKKGREKKKDELINKIINVRGNKTIPYKYFDLSIPIVSDIAHYHSSNNSKKKDEKNMVEYPYLLFLTVDAWGGAYP